MAKNVQSVQSVQATQSAPASTGVPHYGLVQAFPPASDAPQPAKAATIYDDTPAPTAKVASRQAPADPTRRQPASTQQAPPMQAAALAPDPAHPGWAPPRHPWSQAADSSVRFYSLHRQYGVTPDPAPIPPQFFAATADLSEPAGPSPRIISGAGTAAQAARAVQAAEADSSSSQP
jgi:hypothetical protein